MRFSLLFLFFIQFAFGQTDSLALKDFGKGLTEDELRCAVSSFKAMITTDTYERYEEKVRLFARKMGPAMLQVPPEAGDKTFLLNWIQQNFEKTKFASYDEAARLVEEMLDIGTKVFEENKELHFFIARANLEQLMEIRRPLMGRI